MQIDFYTEVSIIMPAYNCEKTISRAIQSVKNQTFKDWTLIIIDDDSKDKTFELANNFTKNDDRIKLFSAPKHKVKGPYFPRNYGIKISNSRFLTFLDSDDEWLPEKLKEQIAFHKKNKIEMSCTSYKKKYNDNKYYYINPPFKISKRTIHQRNHIPMLTVMFDLEKIKSKKFIEFPSIPHEDYALWLKLFNSRIVSECLTINKVLACYYVNESSVSSNKLYSVLWTFNCYRYSGMNIFISIYKCFNCFIFNVAFQSFNFFYRAYRILKKFN